MKAPAQLALIAAIATGSLATTSASADSFATGSVIIPMDTTYQDTGMFKAYGLVYRLLENGVPVKWVIKEGKTQGQADFSVAATNLKTGSAIPTHGYRGGPWVIDAINAGTAAPIINAWQTANPTTTVHVAAGPFTADVAKVLVAAPKVAMHADGNEDISRKYLVAAGIPDSTGDLTWPLTSPDMLTPDDVAGPSTTDHDDGALFESDGTPAYCQFMSMHWKVTDAIAQPEVVAEVREFLTHGTHFFAECQAVNAFENLVPHGRFLTPNGYQIMPKPSSVEFHNFDQTFAQLDGAFKTVGGSEPAYRLPPGDDYKIGGVTMITATGFVEGTNDLWMTGYLDGICPPSENSCGGLGKVSYLGGHKYETKVPISANPDSQGTRLFLNSLFDSDCATEPGSPFILLQKAAPATTLSPTVTYEIAYANGGPSVAFNSILSDPLPAGATFVSATGGGTLSSGTVTWNLGTLGVGEDGTVAVTVELASKGTYENTASLNYKVGLTSFSASSNEVSTVYDTDTDGDEVLDALDNCPDHYNPSQNLSSDIQSCGTCGTICAVANGAADCVAGTCLLSECDSPFADCDGDYATGCEFNGVDFDTDPSNCGGCGVICSVSHATPGCANALCEVGTCDTGFADCNELAGDGCEYPESQHQFDNANCGACGNECGDGFVCSAGLCVIDNCAPGLSDCNGLVGDLCEYDNTGFATDESNCGGCNITCSLPASTSECISSFCAVAACTSGFSDCNGLPGDGCEYANAGFANDSSNCGSCGNACSLAQASSSCTAGACVVSSCQAGFANCNGLAADGCEYATIDLQTDEQNCGACGAACDPSHATGQCVGGACFVGSCDAGFKNLDLAAINGCEYACTVSSVTDETCDGVDDDCNGALDEDFVGTTCGVGACLATSTCSAGSPVCIPGAPALEGPPGAGSCTDSIDNDCNGVTDDSDASCVGCVDDTDCDDGNICTLDECIGLLCANSGISNCGAGGAGGASGGGSTTGGSDATGGAGVGGDLAGGSDAGASATGGAGEGGDSQIGGGSPDAGGGGANGTGAGSNEGGGTASGGSDTTSVTNSTDAGCSCRVAGTPSSSPALLLGAVALAVSRRRRLSRAA